MTSHGDAGRPSVIDQAKEWVLADRVHLFAAGAGAASVLMVASLIIPSAVVSTMAAGGFAVLAILFGLLTGATWWAGRNGATDSADLWDSAPEDTAEVDDLFTGFTSFTEDGAAPGPRATPRGQ